MYLNVRIMVILNVSRCTYYGYIHYFTELKYIKSGNNIYLVCTCYVMVMSSSICWVDLVMIGFLRHFDR